MKELSKTIIVVYAHRVNASYVICVADGFDGNITTNFTAVGPVCLLTMPFQA